MRKNSFATARNITVPIYLNQIFIAHCFRPNSLKANNDPLRSRIRRQSHDLANAGRVSGKGVQSTGFVQAVIIAGKILSLEGILSFQWRIIHPIRPIKPCLLPKDGGRNRVESHTM
ncbi:MAG: hypothetical protein PHI97_03755 [Desulfobulbus sp.]|nr:hypothetical protein [Desulfobulbus sp.]